MLQRQTFDQNIYIKNKHICQEIKSQNKINFNVDDNIKFIMKKI